MKETLEFILSSPMNYLGTLFLILALMFFKPIHFSVHNHPTLIPSDQNDEEDDE